MKNGPNSGAAADPWCDESHNLKVLLTYSAVCSKGVDWLEIRKLPLTVVR